MKNIVWFGNFEFGEFKKGSDFFPCAIVHEVVEEKSMTELEADDYMIANSYGGYLIPRTFNGEIYYSEGGQNA